MALYNADLPRVDDAGILAINDEPYVPLGSQYHDKDTGEIWQYVKAFEALNYADALTMTMNVHTVSTLGTAAPAGSIELNDSGENFFTAGNMERLVRTTRQREHAMLEVVDGTGAGQRATIIEIQQNRLIVEWDTPDGTLQTALDTTSDLEIYAPWMARRSSAEDQPTIGWCQNRNGVEQDKYFWALACGIGTFRLGNANLTCLLYTSPSPRDS